MKQNKIYGTTLNNTISHNYFSHFLVYCLTYIVFGQTLCSLGPLLPYLAAYEQRLQTQYSILFTFRAFGFIFGSISVKYIGKKLSLHKYIITGVGIQTIFCLLFNNVNNIYCKGIIIFFISIGSSFQQINLNLSTLQCFKGNNLSAWLQVIHGCFGIGGLLGPILVYLFQLNTMNFLAFQSIIIIILYYWIVTPENRQNVNEEQNMNKQQKDLPNKSLILTSLCFFCAVGQIHATGGWISSYAVLQNFSTKQHATFYSSLFWISVTSFRFILAAFQGAPSNKIKKLSLLGMFTTVISYYILFYISEQFGMIFISIMLGISNSVLFSLLLTIPQQFGYQLTQHEGSLFLIGAALGEGCLAVGIGNLMSFFTFNWFIYGNFVSNLFLFVFNFFNIQLLTQIKSKQINYNKLDKPLIDNSQLNYTIAMLQVQLHPVHFNKQ